MHRLQSINIIKIQLFRTILTTLITIALITIDTCNNYNKNWETIQCLATAELLTEIEWATSTVKCKLIFKTWVAMSDIIFLMTSSSEFKTSKKVKNL